MRRCTIAGFIFGLCLLAPTFVAAQENNPCLKPIELVRSSGGLLAYLGSDELGNLTKVSNVMFKFHKVVNGIEQSDPVERSNASASLVTPTGFFACGQIVVPLSASLVRDGQTTYHLYVQFENPARAVSGWTKEPLPFVLDPPVAPPPRVPTVRLGPTAG